MKNKILYIILGIVALLSITGVILYFCLNKNDKFYLENEYYGSANITELELDEVNKLIENKESFVIFIYQPLCNTSTGLSEILTEFRNENAISMYSIAFSKIKDQDNFKFIKHYPSFIIYKDGKAIDFLDADSNDDTDKFKDYNTFSKWLKSYIKIKEKPSDFTPYEIPNNTPNEMGELNLKQVKREDNKVNIYFFWGDGCPHCKKEHAFFDAMEKKYKDKYNLYTFEVWYNEENQEILKIFGAAMDEDVRGVPFTIIGNQTFSGFSDEIGEEMLDTIETQYKNSYDVYFDTIKNN